MKCKLFNPCFTVKVVFVELLCDSGIQMGKRKKEILVSNFWVMFPVGIVLFAYEKAVFWQQEQWDFKMSKEKRRKQLQSHLSPHFSPCHEIILRLSNLEFRSLGSTMRSLGNISCFNN